LKLNQEERDNLKASKERNYLEVVQNRQMLLDLGSESEKLKHLKVVEIKCFHLFMFKVGCYSARQGN